MINCSWIGLKNDVKEHVKAAHAEYFFQDSKFRDTLLTGARCIVFCFGEIFKYCKMKHDGRYYAAVQLVGTSNEASKYKCEFTLRAANGVEQISNTFLVYSYSKDWKTIFKSGKCLRLDEDTAKHFVEENELKLTVKLSRV